VVSTILKNMSSSDWIIIPSVGEKNLPNHQPVVVHYPGGPNKLAAKVLAQEIPPELEPPDGRPLLAKDLPTFPET